MVGGKLIWGIAALALLVAVAATAYWTAVGSPSVLEPGPRSSAHEGTDCLRCHDSYVGVSDALGLECHADAANWTWHTVSGGGADCGDCHYEHVGRDRITDLTAVPPCPRGDNLSEAHTGLRCVECHRNGEPTEVCSPCHARYQGDTHLVGYADACDMCHDQTSWVTAYDHEHPGSGGTAGGRKGKTCADCHGGDPPHALPAYASWTDDCDVCHGTSSWTIPAFPHETIVDRCSECHAASLDLAWGGSSGACSDCHAISAWTPTAVVHEQLKGSCLRCHEADPPVQHLSRPELDYLDCDACHGNVTWARTIDHAAYNASCVQCHVEDEEDHEGPYSAECQWCHAIDVWTVVGAHPAQDAACTDCHAEAHLGGDAAAHVDAAHTALCAVCHVGGLNWTIIAVDHEALGSDCAACHVTPHHAYGAGAVACGACHGTGSWVPVVVDHLLLGQDCVSCHPTPHPNAWDQWSEQCTLCHVVTDWKLRSYDHDTSNATAVACVNCHDDVHRGTLGIVCEECHAVDTWETEVVIP